MNQTEVSGVELISQLNPDGYLTGFDKVVIAALGYGDPIPGVGKSHEDSDFVIRSIKFPTKFSSTAKINVSGNVDINSGADGLAEGAVPVQFASDYINAVINGEEVSVHVKPSEDGTAVVATYTDAKGVEKTLFTGIMDAENIGKFDLKLYHCCPANE